MISIEEISCKYTQIIPQRTDSMKSGSEFIKTIMNLTGQPREDLIYQELTTGNIPDFLRTLCPVTVTDKDNTLTYMVMPDYLAIGSDSDYMRIPTFPGTGRKIADQYDFALPTRKMYNDIWKAAQNKILPKPHGPPYDLSIIKTDRYEIINNKLNQAMVGLDKSQLTFGGKKSIVLTNKLLQYKNNVAIYGWSNADGSVIQGLNPVDHDRFYCDYSHSLTFIAKDMILNGECARFYDILNNKEFCSLLSDEGSYDASRIYIW